jgi:rare lipoprotein A (peptidoglycan hydrolase)
MLKMKKSIFLAGLFSCTFMVHAQSVSETPTKSAKHHKSRKEVSKFEGRKTANGETFSQSKFTGASNILPLNEWVRVTNLRNKLYVVLRITDRMHKNNKRLVDLSKSAAKKLKYTGYGLAHVKVEVLGKKLPQGIVRG